MAPATTPSASLPPRCGLAEREIHVVIEGELEITVDRVYKIVQAGGVAHVSANTVHGRSRTGTDAAGPPSLVRCAPGLAESLGAWDVRGQLMTPGSPDAI